MVSCFVCKLIINRHLFLPCFPCQAPKVRHVFPVKSKVVMFSLTSAKTRHVFPDKCKKSPCFPSRVQKVVRFSFSSAKSRHAFPAKCKNHSGAKKYQVLFKDSCRVTNIIKFSTIVYTLHTHPDSMNISTSAPCHIPLLPYVYTYVLVLVYSLRYRCCRTRILYMYQSTRNCNKYQIFEGLGLFQVLTHSASHAWARVSCCVSTRSARLAEYDSGPVRGEGKVIRRQNERQKERQNERQR